MPIRQRAPRNIPRVGFSSLCFSSVCLLSLSFLVLWPGLDARAETTVYNDPVITLEPSVFADQYRRISTEDLASQATLQFAWTTQGGAIGTYNFEIRYGSVDGPLVRMSNPNESTRRNLNSGQLTAIGETLIFELTPEQIVWTTDDGERTPFEGTRDIVVHVFQPGAQDRTDPNIKGWTFDVDTLAPPPGILIGLTAGENRLGVSWDAPSSRSADIETYEIVYCPNSSLPLDSDLDLSQTSTAAGPCEEKLQCAVSLRSKARIDKTLRDESITDGLANGVHVAVAMRAKDDFGNVGECGNVLVGAPTDVTDFFEYYRARGGTEDGGYCFIATAAHGSYAHPVVRVLRLFRDQILERTPWGAQFVRTYYALSPPLADEIREDATLAEWTRFLLLPVAGVGLLAVLLPGFGGLMIIRSFVRRRGRQHAGEAQRAGLFLILLLGASVAWPHEASAKRAEGELPIGLGFEFKGGPYLPAVAEQGGTASDAPPFEVIFGDKKNPLYTLGLDLQLYRGVGTAGVGFAFGFMQFVGRGLYADTGLPSRDTTVFNILPLDMTLFYRFDWLADQMWFPLVPYARGGLTYNVWWVTNGVGNLARDRGDPNTPDDDIVARGGKFGLTGTLGVAILLNAFDSGSARALFNSTGFRGTYIFAEMQSKTVDGFGSQGFDLSDTTWNLGFYLEM